MSDEVLPKPNSLIANHLNAETKTDAIKSVIHQVLGPDFGKGVWKRTHQLDNDTDALNIMIATLLHYTTKQTKDFVNKERQDRGLAPVNIDRRDIYNFKQVYANILDDAYVATAKYIGDVHPYADKMHRIGILNDIVSKLSNVVNELDFPDDFSLKKANLLLKSLDRINVEMGNKTMQDFLTPRRKPSPEELDEDGPVSEEIVKKLLDKRYSNQMPERIIEEAVITQQPNEPNGISSSATN